MGRSSILSRKATGGVAPAAAGPSTRIHIWARALGVSVFTASRKRTRRPRKVAASNSCHTLTATFGGALASRVRTTDCMPRRRSSVLRLALMPGCCRGTYQEKVAAPGVPFSKSRFAGPGCWATARKSIVATSRSTAKPRRVAVKTAGRDMIDRIPGKRPAYCTSLHGQRSRRQRDTPTQPDSWLSRARNGRIDRTYRRLPGRRDRGAHLLSRHRHEQLAWRQVGGDRSRVDQQDRLGESGGAPGVDASGGQEES